MTGTLHNEKVTTPVHLPVSEVAATHGKAHLRPLEGLVMSSERSCRTGRRPRKLITPAFGVQLVRMHCFGQQNSSPGSQAPTGVYWPTAAQAAARRSCGFSRLLANTAPLPGAQRP